MKSAVLCADAEVLRHPGALGLPDENLQAQPWLETFSDADEARTFIAGAKGPANIWVAGSDQVDAINLAAAIRQDGGSPSLVAFQGTGSLFSRAHAAGIREVLDKQAFLERYGACKQAALLGDAAGRPQAPAFSGGHAGSLGEASGPGFPAAAPVDGTASAPDAFAGFSTFVTEGNVATDPRVRVQADALSAPSATAQALPGAQMPVVMRPAPEALASAGAAAAPVMAPVQAPASKSQIVPVVGAGGGMGKSTLAVICACLAQDMGHRTVILDADLQGGDVHYLMGVEDALRIDALIKEPGRVATLEPNGRMPAVVAAPDAVERSEMIAPLVKDVCALLATRFDVVIVNTSPCWSDIQMDLIGIASRVLFVLDQRPTALRLCKRVLDLCARCGVASRSFIMVLNRCSRQSLFSSIDVSCTLSGIRSVEAKEGGKGLSESLGSGAPFEAIDGRNAFCESVQELVSEILPSPTGASYGEQPKKRRRRRARDKR